MTHSHRLQATRKKRRGFSALGRLWLQSLDIKEKNMEYDTISEVIDEKLSISSETIEELDSFKKKEKFQNLPGDIPSRFFGAAGHHCCGYMKRTILVLTLGCVAPTAYSLPFKGDTLPEMEIRQLYESQCKEFMVNSASSKSAMPEKLVKILSQGEKLITAKVLACELKGVVFEFYLTQKGNQWIMYDAESITIRPSNGSHKMREAP